uniref:protein-tyrosine-phosphatase n=1 Tax=Anser cygnoides TaxID=8845 RepID=A0A8B9EKP8_ANSCY
SWAPGIPPYLPGSRLLTLGALDQEPASCVALGLQSHLVLCPAHRCPVLTCCFPLQQGGPVEILPFLYLGSAYHAARRDMLDALGITALLNVSSDCPNHFEGHYQYKCIPVEDNHKADISSWFMEAIEYIGECLLGAAASVWFSTPRPPPPPTPSLSSASLSLSASTPPPAASRTCTAPSRCHPAVSSGSEASQADRGGVGRAGEQGAL